MPTTEELKALVCQAIDQRAKEITGIFQHILAHPETGYREQMTYSHQPKLSSNAMAP